MGHQIQENLTVHVAYYVEWDELRDAAQAAVDSLKAKGCEKVFVDAPRQGRHLHIYGWRPETKEDELDRCRAAEEFALRERERERQEYKRLKARFETKE